MTQGLKMLDEPRERNPYRQRIDKNVATARQRNKLPTAWRINGNIGLIDFMYLSVYTIMCVIHLILWRRSDGQA